MLHALRLFLFPPETWRVRWRVVIGMVLVVGGGLITALEFLLHDHRVLGYGLLLCIYPVQYLLLRRVSRERPPGS